MKFNNINDMNNAFTAYNTECKAMMALPREERKNTPKPVKPLTGVSYYAHLYVLGGRTSDAKQNILQSGYSLIANTFGDDDPRTKAAHARWAAYCAELDAGN